MSDLALNDAAPAVLDIAHIGDIQGALGTIRHADHAARRGLRARFATLLAILGPGLIVMIGDNDAGAFSTYAQAGQDYGLALLWTLPLLVPVLYLNQEMVARLGAVTGVGHARLILERFGRFWGAFSVIDLFLLNALTIVTEFIGINLALGYLGVSRPLGIGLAAVLIVAAASTGSFRRFERFSLMLCFFSLLLIPVFMLAHPPLRDIGHALIVPSVPHGANLSNLMLLVIAIIGTTIAPWQLFFQQSYVIDKRITPRFLAYEKTDLWIGIVVVLVGAIAMMSFTAGAFTGTAGFGHFTDAGAVARGLEAYAGRGAGVMFALALLDASIIGASAVSLSTAYALGDVLSLRHSLPPQGDGCPRLLRRLCRTDRGCRLPRAVRQRRAFGIADQRRADPGRRSTPLCNCFPAPALQRPRRVGTVDERAVAQPCNRCRDLGAADAVGGPDRGHHLPQPIRPHHADGRRCRHAVHDHRRAVRAARTHIGHPGDSARLVAHAAVGGPAATSNDPRHPDSGWVRFGFIS